MPHTGYVRNQHALSSSAAIEKTPVETPADDQGTGMALTGDEIRERMAMIRTHIEEHSDEVIAQTDALSDWRFYVRRYPWVAVTAAAAVGYAVVPQRRKSGEEARTRKADKRSGPLNAADLRSALTGTAQRAAMTYANMRLGDVLGRFLAGDGDA